MTGPAAPYRELLDPRNFRVVERALAVLQGHAVDYVLGGGWAVYAHAPGTPSVDCDLYLREPLPAQVVERLQREGLSVGPHREVEPLAMHDRVEFWGLGDEDLGIPLPGFRVADLLQGRVVRRPLALPGRTIDVRVPDAPSLSLLKLCALHNRDLAYRSFHDPRAAALLDPSRATQVRAMADSYYLRKAGKDCFDASLLLGADAAPEAAALAESFGVRGAVAETLRSPDPLVAEMGEALARRVGAPPPLARLRAAFGSDG